jgi:hypothetical protein
MYCASRPLLLSFVRNRNLCSAIETSLCSKKAQLIAPFH